jgi:DNA-binding transcriptional LysR family regulator
MSSIVVAHSVKRAMEIELLRTFVAICDTRSFTAAARQVGRTQSAVSLQVRRIEEQLGRPLFIRGPGQIELTPHGDKFAGYARSILDTYREALGAFDRAAVDGVVVLGMPEDYTARILPMVLERFIAIYPKATVDIVVDRSKNLIKHLADGAVDLAFVTEGQGPIGDGEVAFHDRMIWVVGEDDSCCLADPLPVAIAHEGDTYAEYLTGTLTEAGRTFRVAVTSKSLTGLRGAVRAGIAVSVMASSALTPGLRELPPAWGFPPLPELTVRLERAHLRRSPVVERLRQHLMDGFAS